MFKKVQILSVVAQGFKGCQDVVTFTFDAGKNEFIGDNGLGKSSIGEMIAWVFTGRNIQGKQKELNIVNKDTIKADVILNFLDENGDQHEIRRKMKNGKNTLYIDFDTISQKKFEELIPAEMFLSIFNPIYFVSLDTDASRKAISSLLPAITKEDVLVEMNSYEQTMLGKESFYIHDTNEYLKNRRQELKENDEELKYMEGYMGKLEEKIIIPEPKSFDDKALVAVQEQLEALRQQKAPVINIQDALEKRNGVQQQLVRVQHEVFGKANDKVEAMNKKALLTQQIQNEQQKVYQPFNPSQLETQLGILRSDYKHVRTNHLQLGEQAKQLDSKHVHVKEGDNCPYCRQTISEQSVKILADELAKEVQKEKNELKGKQQAEEKSLAQLEAEGKKLLADIEKAKKEDDQKRQQFEEAKAKTIASLEQQIREIESQLKEWEKEEQAFNQEKQARIQQLQKELDALGVAKLQEENARIEREFTTRIQAEKTAIQTELNRLQKEKEEVVKHETLRQNLQAQFEKQQAELKRCEALMKSYQEKEAELQMKITLMKSFNSKKIEMTNRTISAHLKDVVIKLQKTVEATGEIKDCFEILYQGKELKVCSTSETIRAGLEISHMMSTLSGFNYPVFVDNGESITSYNSVAEQIIEVRVVKGKPLSKVVGDTEAVIVATKPVKRDPDPYARLNPFNRTAV